MTRLIALLALCAATSCGACGEWQTTAALAACAKSLRGSIAVVNGWPGIDATLYAQELAENCQTLTLIEAYPCQRRICPEEPIPYRFERRAFLRAMAEHGITTIVTAMNSNMKLRGLSEAAFREHVRSIRDDALEIGIQYVWLGSPSEPWAWERERAMRFAVAAREEWPATFVLPDAGANRPLGRPYFQDIAYDWLEVHPCSLAEAYTALRTAPPDTLIVTDCTPVLNPGPLVATDMALEAYRMDRPLIFYDFMAIAPDTVGLRAIGESLR